MPSWSGSEVFSAQDQNQAHNISLMMFDDACTRAYTACIDAHANTIRIQKTCMMQRAKMGKVMIPPSGPNQTMKKHWRGSSASSKWEHLRYSIQELKETYGIRIQDSIVFTPPLHIIVLPLHFAYLLYLAMRTAQVILNATHFSRVTCANSLPNKA